MSNSCVETTKTKQELKKAFQSAESVEETLKLLKEMESCCQESELGFEYFVFASRISKLGKDFEQVLCFGKRALTILTDEFKRTKCGSYLLIADVLLLLGSACVYLKRYDESLSYLIRADKNLSMLKGKERNNRGVVNTEIHIQIELMNVKAAMGMKEEAVVHAKKVLEIKEKVMDEGSVGLGEAYMGVSVAYIEAFDSEKALPYCLKALDIFTEKLGRDSAEAAEVMRHLSIIYHRMEKYEKAFELNRLAMTNLKISTPDYPYLLTAEVEGADALVSLGRCEEAIDVLKGVVSRDDIGETLRVKSLIVMATALCFLDKFADAEKYISVVERMLEDKEMNPVFAAVGYVDISMLYQKVNDFETAISVMKKGLALPGIPQNLLPRLCSALMSLISKAGKDKEEVPFMEDELEKLKVYFGPEHCVVGYCYSSLGAVYMGLGQRELAAKSLANAKDILDVTLDPHHTTSMKASLALSVCYATLGRFHQALEVVEEIAKGLKGLDPSELRFMHEVVKHLNRMKERVAESSTRASSQSEDE